MDVIESLRNWIKENFQNMKNKLIPYGKQEIDNEDIESVIKF